uniref:Ig-like domain-containing protein n=1 Tax=Oryzias melastigma TaxID=30732 RepID=A0A3B3CRH9_ORYME
VSLQWGGGAGLLSTCSTGENTREAEWRRAKRSELCLCRNENINQVFLLEWTKPNLKGEETVFLYRSDGILLDQHESFRNRVSLKNSQMKDGDLSVVLENVKIEDSGTYQCRILQENGSQRRWSLISSIHLQVLDLLRRNLIYVLLSVLVVVFVVVVSVFYKKRTRRSEFQKNLEVETVVKMCPQSNVSRSECEPNLLS